jgi:hypothetical protein
MQGKEYHFSLLGRALSRNRSQFSERIEGPEEKPASFAVCCREIGQADIESVIELLTDGFGRYRDKGYWVGAMRRLSRHNTPEGYPKYGYLLECAGAPVGVLLLIYSRVELDGAFSIRCNVSSWYVAPPFSAFSTILASTATRHRHVTYINVSPAPHTWPILEAQGYRRFANGLFLSIPMLTEASYRSRITAITPDDSPGDDLQQPELELLATHSNYGCISLICESEGRRHPFVFGLSMKYGFVSFAHLIYCRGEHDFVKFAGPLGRFLARRGVPFVVLSANGTISGLVGRYFDGQPKYFKGPQQPNPCDVAYSERVMFGF